MTIEDRVALHTDICIEITSLYEEKNIRYGNSFEKTYKKFGIVSSAMRLEDKFNRMYELINDPELPTKDETLRDTIIDLANYAIMTLMEYDKGEA